MPDAFMGTSSPIDADRIAAALNGYKPLPVAGIHMSVKSPGKQPVDSDWRQKFSRPIAEQSIREWSKKSPDCTNTGILTGLSGGVGAIDIDVRVQAAADEVRDFVTEVIGRTECWRVGEAPKILGLYRVINKFSKVKTQTFIMPDGTEAAVEFLAEGQQVVAFGFHPKTRQPYKWLGASPASKHIDELPIADLDAVEVVIEGAAQILREHGGVLKLSKKSNAGKERPIGSTSFNRTAPTGDNFFSRTNSLALNNLGRWVQPLFGDAARYQPETKAYRIRSKDLNRNHEEDLSLHPTGIYDFGKEEPLSSIDTVMEHGGAPDAVKAALWICEKVGVDPASLGWIEKRQPEAKTTANTKTIPNSGQAAKAAPPCLDSAEDVLETFNTKYAVVNEAGKVVVYNPKRDEQLKRDTIERIMFEDFKRMYMNRRVQVGSTKKGGPIFSDVGTIWLEHPQRRQYLGGVVMDPAGKAPADCWNLWRGFNVNPQAGDWSLMRNHIVKVLCNGDESLAEYVIGWLARMVQHPDKPGEVALVLRGKKGTGKGTLGNWMVRLFGQHSLHISHAKHLVGNFNAHLRDAVFVFADEAFFAGDKAHEGTLKSLVTEPFITVEAKYQNAVTIPNMTHILMASNNDWVVPASADERRYFVLEVSDCHIQDIPYFTKLNDQMENGGLSAMLHDLLDYDLSNFNVRKVPQTEALADQKRLSMDSLHRWWSTVLHRGFVLRSRYGSKFFLDWSEFTSTELLHESYKQWCVDNREHRPMSREQLGVMMKGTYKPHRPRGSFPIYEVDALDGSGGHPAVMQERPPGYKVGSLDQARETFVAKAGIAFDWGDGDDEDTID